MTIVSLTAATLAFAIGVTVLWANPHRLTNRIFSALWFMFTVWFVMVRQAMIAESKVGPGPNEDAMLWLRANSAVVALVPLLVWMLKESIASVSATLWDPLRRSLPIAGASLVLFGLSFADSFVLPTHSDGRYHRGPAYSLYLSIEFMVYTWFVIDCWRQIRSHRGIQKLELQLLALTTGTTGLVATSTIGVGNILGSQAMRRATLFVLLGGFALTAWAITAHRIFDTRQVFSSLGQRVLVLLSTALAALGLYVAIDTVGSHSAALFSAVLIATAAGFWLDRKSREWLRMTSEDAQLRLRSATIDLARTEPNPEHLVREFENLLRRESQASFVTLGFEDAVGHDFNRFDLAKNSPAHNLLCQLGWATPEGLQRRRSTEASRALQAILARHSLGLIIPVPRGTPSPSLLAVFGVRENAWPFTYPEVQKFQNVAEFMDNILTRSRLTAQAALKAKTEHLAMLSRGLAHDLKNLLTPVSSFLVYTEGRFPAESVEAEVHGAAQRSIRIMNEYVREARFFAEQLTPRFERVSVRSIFDGVHDVVQARAAARNISLAFDSGHDASAVVDRVLIQRLLANLVANAIDASTVGHAVALSGEIAGARLRFQVKDQGCGIAPEHLGRIFEAYFTTKEFGDTVRGFGLGLTICQKIAALHHGEITVQTELGKGSTFTVSIPTTPSEV